MVPEDVQHLHLEDHWFEVPLDPSDPSGQLITVYAREVTARGGEQRPWLLFLQGGPGSPGPRPTEVTGWVERAVRDFRVLLLDQRGTGRSSPVTRRTMELLGSPTHQFEHLRHFRADAIVSDCELIRQRLVGPAGRWSLLGQSYGGFCATTYLSRAPDFLDRVLITGGLPPLDAHPDDVYRLAYAEARRRSRRFAELYPSSYANLQAARDLLLESPVVLADGDMLTVERLQRLGLMLGASGGYASLGYLLEDIWDGHHRLSDRFLLDLQVETSFRTNPLFPVMLEPCYAQGQAPQWSAARVRSEFPEFAEDADALLLTGEMMSPATFEGHSGLTEFSGAAQLLAEFDGWPPLYDHHRLSRNRVPVAALVYAQDMYVPPALSLDTASRIPGTEMWTTNEYEHDGLRRDGGRILDRLLDLVHRRPTPDPGSRATIVG